MLEGNPDHAAWGLHSFCFAIQLIPESLYVVQAIGDHNGVLSQSSLYSRVFCSPSVLLRPSLSVDIATEAQRLVTDMADCQAADSCIRRSLNPGVEGFDQLIGTVGLS